MVNWYSYYVSILRNVCVHNSNYKINQVMVSENPDLNLKPKTEIPVSSGFEVSSSSLQAFCYNSTFKFGHMGLNDTKLCT